MVYLEGHSGNDYVCLCQQSCDSEIYNQRWTVKLPAIDDDERTTLIDEVRCIPMLDQLEDFRVSTWKNKFGDLVCSHPEGTILPCIFPES